MSAFAYMSAISPFSLHNPEKLVSLYGVVPRVHWNTDKGPSHALEYADVRYSVKCLLCYCGVEKQTVYQYQQPYGDMIEKFLPVSQSDLTKRITFRIRKCMHSTSSMSVRSNII